MGKPGAIFKVLGLDLGLPPLQGLMVPAGSLTQKGTWLASMVPGALPALLTYARTLTLMPHLPPQQQSEGKE